jgi:hypothetical protein
MIMNNEAGGASEGVAVVAYFKIYLGISLEMGQPTIWQDD